MRAAALLVAVETYADPGLNLNGPAGDASRIRQWLLGHGGVTADDMTVLISSRKKRLQANGPATLDAVFAALLKLSKKGADRVYFYFSGHGIAVAPDRKRQYLLMADFHDYEAPHKAVVFQEVADYLQSIAPEHLLISDACRNFYFDESTATIGTHLPADRWVPLPAGQPVSRGALLFGASPGGVSYLAPDRKAPESVFTAELLDGLDGKDCAKRWDPGQRQYVVDTDRVLGYVRKAVCSRLAADSRLPADVNPEEVAAAIEMQTTQNPLVLRRIPKEDVAKVRLSVALCPDIVGRASPRVEVRVEEFPCDHWQPAEPVIPPVAPFHLQPRCYNLAARAAGYRQETEPLACEPYAEEQEETVQLVPSGDRGQPGPGTPPPLPSPKRSGADAEAGTLSVSGPDPLQPFEVTSESGAFVGVGAGTAAFRLPAGFYRVRPLASGDGTFGDRPADRFYRGSHVAGPEWLARVGRDAESTVRLPPARALPSRLQPFMREWAGDDRRWADWFGESADPQVPTLLAYLAEQWAPELSGMVGGSRVAASPLLVLTAVDADDSDEAEDFTGRLEVRVPDEDARLTLSPSDVPGLASAVIPVRPGAVSVRVGPKSGDSVDVRVPILAGRPTALIWYVDRAGRLEVRISCPRPDGPADYGRRLDLMQQLAALGRTGAVRQVAEPLLRPDDADPVAAVIAGATLRRMPPRDSEDKAAPPALRADDQVFWTASQERLGNPLARQWFRELASTGPLPVTAAATRLLCAGLLRHAPESLRVGQLARMLTNQMTGSPWSAAWVEATSDQGLPTPPGTRQKSPAAPTAQKETAQKETARALAYS